MSAPPRSVRMRRIFAHTTCRMLSSTGNPMEPRTIIGAMIAWLVQWARRPWSEFSVVTNPALQNAETEKKTL